MLVAAAAMSSRQKQLAMMHRPGPIGGTLRANRVGAGQPIGRTHQFAGLYKRERESLGKGVRIPYKYTFIGMCVRCVCAQESEEPLYLK